MACASGAARLRADRATGGSCAHTNGHCGAGGACTRVCTRVRGGPERDERATRREGCFSGPPRHTPPLLALSGVSGGAGSPQWVGGSLSVPPGLGAGWWPPAQSKGNALGVVGPWHPHPGFLVPDAASSFHLPSSQRCIGSLAGGTRRPEVLAKPVFLARVIFV